MNVIMGKVKDLTGQKFGKLTAIRPTDQRTVDNCVIWECKCDCGNPCYVSSHYLRSGHTKSCGCLKQQTYHTTDLVGQKFNSLTVLEKTDRKYRNSYIWKCLCDCGEICYVSTPNLTSGKVKSCGCRKTAKLQGRRFGSLVALEPTSERRSNSVVWKCQCDCGNIHYVDAVTLLSGNSTSCGCRTQSKGAETIEHILTINNLTYDKEYRISECREKYPLPFDFIVRTTNNFYLIEFDGKQHFEPIEYWGGEANFKAQQKRDSIKNEYCLLHNIPLIRIPYTHTDITLEDLQPETSQFLLTKL